MKPKKIYDRQTRKLAMNRTINLTGKKFGRLTVIKFDKVINGNAYWLCKCKCGTSKVINGSSLRREQTKSCGCLRNEKTTKRNTTHGRHGTREHKSWERMKSRCLNKNNTGYKDYGGRDITICKRWLKFENFYIDMKKRPKNTSLDRIDNNKGYSKTNCRWATPKEQSRNTRRNINITYQGKTQCMKAWAEELNINYETLVYHIKNWSIKKAFNM